MMLRRAVIGNLGRLLQTTGVAQLETVCRMSSAADVKCRRLEGKIAIVTASTDGIGFAIARRLGQEGAHVVVSSRKEDNVQKALQQLKTENLDVSGLVCHVGKSADRKNLIERTVKNKGGLDILVSNAGINPMAGSILDTNEEVWDKIFDVNVKAAFLLCQEAAPHMEKRGGGSVVFVSSITGYTPFEALGTYSVSKTALLGLTKALATPLARKNIRVNCLAPGIIKTGFSSLLWKTEAIHTKILEEVPLGRLGEPEDCAGSVAFLVSDDSKYITGETILTTGGMTARL